MGPALVPALALAFAMSLIALPAGAQGPRPALEMLRDHLALPRSDRPEPETQVFWELPLSKQAAAQAIQALWSDRASGLRESRRAAWDGREITIDGRTMRFEYRVFGEPKQHEHADDADGAPVGGAQGELGGRRLFISMHGGGGTTPEVNDQQWRNQVRLYQPEEGVYLAPRAPTNTWNLWHEAHIDAFFDRIIEDAVIFEGVDPDRVYLMGYSAGGDGVYQVGPRMADRWAAAAMMAGHPNEAQPLSLRNTPFAIHMGENDSAYKRNEVAVAWGQKLDSLRREDPSGYVHVAKLHAGKGHWMDREDAEAVAWMSGFVRNAWPERVVWFQDDVTHTRLYWLQVAPEDRVAGSTLSARMERDAEAQTIRIERASGFGGRTSLEVTILLHDALLDLDRPVRVVMGDDVLFEGVVARTIASIATSLDDRGDPRLAASARVTVSLPLEP